MGSELRTIELELKRIKAEIEALLRRIEAFKKLSPDEPPPFTKMAGILKGKAHFTDEDIEAAKIRVGKPSSE